MEYAVNAVHCIYPREDTFLRAECATNSLMRAQKNRAVSTMN